jgi:septal ring factor EnvC (AmiA/AmiB activator)
LLVLCSAPLRAQDSPDRRHELRRLENEIATLKKSIDDLRTESSTVVRDVERYRLQREMHAREIARFGIDIRATDESIDRLEREIAANNQIIASKREAVAGLLRRLYMNGRFDRLKALLNVPSAQDVALAHTYLTFLARADFELLTSYRTAVDRFKADQRSLDREKSRLVILREEERAKEREAAAAQREQERILDGIRRKSGIYEKALREKEVSRRDLIQFLSRLGDAESSGENTGTGFERLRGALAWPARGEVIAAFGTIRDQTYDVTIENDGIDIKASVGTPVHAVAAGTAVYCGWQDAGGNMVVVDHGSGYYTLYAHLSRFSVETGAAVEAGQQIGEVGETGSLKGPILHFEIRRIMRGQEPRALDPVAWLRKAP